MRRLMVMRHGKSDWNAGKPDHERPLNGRGRRSADAMGRLLAGVGEIPEVAITSTAERARTTLERAVAAGGWSTTEVHHEPAFYGAAVSEVLDVLADAPDVGRLMVVGHDPTWTHLVSILTDADVRVTTATVVGIDLPDAPWSTAARPGGGGLAYVLPSRLALRLYEDG